MSVTRIQPAYQMLNYIPADRRDTPVRQAKGMNGVDFGPAIGDLERHADKMLLLRGINMDTLTHQAGRRRFLTGKPPIGISARGNSTDTWLSAKLAKDEPMPNLAVRMESYNPTLSSKYSAIKADGSDALVSLLGPGDVTMDPTTEAQVSAMLAEQARCNRVQLSKSVQSAEIARQSTQQVLQRRLDTMFDFRNDSTAALRDKFGISLNGFSPSSGRVQAAIAATALTQGMSRVVSFEAVRGLDTHFVNWTTDQLPKQVEGFDAVAKLVDYLAETPFKGDPNASSSWLDHTTIVGFSEFSRTPLINASTGRDHWLNNAAFLIGGDIKGAVPWVDPATSP